MNLSKLFDAQKKLRERINYNGEDRFEKLILALLVEIGECANEWRGFKFWSKNQEPTKPVYTNAGVTNENVAALSCSDCGDFTRKGHQWFELIMKDHDHKCLHCGTPEMDLLREKDSLLEEYVDCLHFILELGIEKKFDVTCDFSTVNDFNIGLATEVDTTWQFIRVHQAVNEFWMNGEIDDYEDIWLVFVGLSKHLRFTWEEVEAAYFSKNQINHERQNNGY